MDAVDEALAARRAPRAGDVERFVHGMTVGTNALLEGRVARTALLATEGFTDLEELGRQARAGAVPALRRPPPAARAGRAARAGARAHRARRRAARRSTRTRCARRSTGLDVRGRGRLPAVGLPPSRSTSGARPSCSRRRWPGVHVSTSHETAGVFREYERCATTIVDAALSPLLRGYLERLTDRARDAGLPEPEVMLSSGGTAERGARRRGTPRGRCCRGRPAARWARARAAWRAGVRRASASTWAAPRATSRCRGRRRRGGQRPRGRRPRARAADGRRAHGRRRRRLDRVARRRRRAARGPALGGRRSRARPATGAAASEPTVTDANLLLGHLDAGLAAGRRRARSTARPPSGSWAGSATSSAWASRRRPPGIVRVASAEMAQAVRVVTVERGIDPRELALVAVRRRRARCTPPRSPTSWACAACSCRWRPACCRRFGLWSSPSAAATWSRACCSRGDELTARGGRPRWSTRLARARPRASSATPRAPSCAPRYDLRYAGQAFELPVDGRARARAGRAARAPSTAPTRSATATRTADAELELVTVRVAVAAARRRAAAPATPAERAAPRFGDERVEAPRSCAGAAELDGPAIVELPGADARGAAGLARRAATPTRR